MPERLHQAQHAVLARSRAQQHRTDQPFAQFAREIVEHRIARRRNIFDQAEDGIRDLTVTGVQTCALPISRGPSSRSPTPRNTASTSATILSDHPIAARWRVVRDERRAALIPYLTAGYPTPARAVEALRMAETAGVDLIEVGVPFSDPLADGVTIQRSTQAALDQGV